MNEIFPERAEEFLVFNGKCKEFYKNTYLIIPFETICFISERPTEIHLKKSSDTRKVFHNEKGPCVKFKDGYEFYALNGVRMDQQIVMAKAEDLDPRIILKEQNVEIRRELVRKIGIERVCAALNAKVKDKWKDYELLLLDLGDGRQRPYLKMLNPSIGTIHMEGVDPKCETVTQALAWRNGLDVFTEPEILT